MSIIQTTSEYSQADHTQCKHCNTILPAHAAFCSTCGEPIEKNNSSPTPDAPDLAERYRITSLIRRLPFVQLFRAMDTEQQRPVVMRDIDITHLDDDRRTQAINAAQQEFDLLHSERIQNVMPVASMHHFEGHLFTITEWPFTINKSAQGGSGRHRHIYTLQDLLQSGIGLPDEQKAISWSYRLCQAVADLHKHQIIIAELDPNTIIVSDDNYNAVPVLTVSWLPGPIRALLPETAIATNVAHFSAPEALLGKPEPRSDIYSLGAILYLLLTGTAPDDPATRMKQRLHSPRELNPRVSIGADETVMWALSMDSDERFQSADEMLNALARLTASTKPARSGTRPLVSGKFTRPLTNGSDKEKRANTAVSSSEGIVEGKKEKRASTAASSSEDVVEGKQDNDVTISIVPLQRQLARRWHISRIPTRRLTPLKALAIEKIVEGAIQAPAEAAKTEHAQEISIQDAQLPTQTQTQIEDISPATSSVEAPPTDSVQDVQTTVRSAETLVEALPVEASAEVLTSDTAPTVPPSAAAIDVVDTVPVTPSPEVLTSDIAPTGQSSAAAIDAVDTVPVTPSPEVPTIDAGQDTTSTESPVEAPLSDAQPVQDLEEVAPVDSLSSQTDSQQEEEKLSLAEPEPDTIKRPVMLPVPESDPTEGAENAMGQFFKDLLTGTVPTLPGLVKAGRSHDKATKAVPAAESFFKRLQRFILGEQQRSTTAAALVETPLRIQPKQSYAIRIHIMGRNETKKDAAGLSSFVQGETVHIEVRSDLYENFAYIVQQADVQIPGRGYAVEVMMPMQPLSNGPSGRRERLHILFTDEARQPLYDKPFVVEIFISHLVQSGREGHNVLTIPL